MHCHATAGSESPPMFYLAEALLLNVVLVNLLKGPMIPFGAAIKYQPSSHKDKARLHQLTTKVLDGILLGYCQMSGGNWNGDLYVVDREELAEADTPDEVTVKRFKASEVHIDKPEGKFYFPVAEGDWTQPNRDEHLRAVQEKKRARKRRYEEEY